MASSSSHDAGKAVLLIGASRGLGFAMAEVFVSRGWSVVATVRSDEPPALHELIERSGGRVSVEALDITRPDQLASLQERLAGRQFDMLFVNAGTASAVDDSLTNMATDEFEHVMVTNALGPMRTIEGLRDLVAEEGVIGVMSSGQGSIANNKDGQHPVYRASKAALNQLMRSHAAKHAGDSRALVLMAPGWIRTNLGGANAPFSAEDTMPKVIDVLIAQGGTPGLRYLDRHGETVPW